jgi:hypothetical protein
MRATPHSWLIVTIPLWLAVMALSSPLLARFVSAILRFFSRGAYRLLSILLFGAVFMLITSVALYGYLKNVHESYAALYFAAACCALYFWAAARYAYEIRNGTWQRMWTFVLVEWQKASVLPQMISISAEDFRARVKTVRRTLNLAGTVALIVFLLPVLFLSSRTLRLAPGTTEDMAGLAMLVSLVAIPLFILISVRNVCWRCGVFCPRCGPRKVHVNFMNYVLRHGCCPKCKYPIFALPESGTSNQYNG